MFCPKCGSKKVVDVFCADCLKEEKPLVSSFKEFKAEICSGCGMVKYKGKWQKTDEPQHKLEKDFTEQVVSPNYATIERVDVVLDDDIPLKDGLKVTGEATVRVLGKASTEATSYVEEYVVPYEVQNKHCRPCSKQGTQYFEGTLQVRNEDTERKKFVLDTLHRFKGGIMKEVRQKKGTDYFVTSNSAIEKTARALQGKFGGVVKSSAHIWGRDHLRSKDLFRETWYVEMPPFQRGEAVQRGKSVLFIVDLGKKIRFYNPVRGKYEYHEFRQGSFHQVPVLETTISAVHPEVTIIHPETFQAVKAWNMKLKPHEPGEEIKVVLDGQKVYIYEVVK